MTDKTGGPAFATVAVGPAGDIYGTEGMTLRQYAAIHLKQPDSGDEWLDEMIVASKRDEYAGRIYQGLVSNSHLNTEKNKTWLAGFSYSHADQMIKERENDQT